MLLSEKTVKRESFPSDSQIFRSYKLNKSGYRINPEKIHGGYSSNKE